MPKILEKNIGRFGLSDPGGDSISDYWKEGGQMTCSPSTYLFYYKNDSMLDFCRLIQLSEQEGVNLQELVWCYASQYEEIITYRWKKQ